jgi:hypothetical protein
LFQVNKDGFIFFSFLATGSGANGTTPVGKGGGWDSESLRVFNARQESGNGTREAENWVPICASIWDPHPKLGPALPGDSYPEVGSTRISAEVWKAIRGTPNHPLRP